MCCSGNPGQRGSFSRAMLERRSGFLRFDSSFGRAEGEMPGDRSRPLSACTSADLQETKMKESVAEENPLALLKTDTVDEGSAEKMKALNIKHREKDLNSFNKNLLHTRHLISAVKKGHGYFHLLKKEEEMKTKVLPAEKQRLELQSTSQEDIVDVQKEETRMMDSGQASFLRTDDSLQKRPRRMKQTSTRPFTPVYNSLFSDKLSEVDPMALFRQLCALHWLLEALNEESSTTTTMTPVYNCWNAREPGGCRTTLKGINKEKAVQLKWEHFVTPGKTKKFLQRSVRSQYFPRRKSSFMSVSRLSGLSSTMDSTSSLIDSGATTEGHREGEDSDSVASSSFILCKSSQENENAMSDYLRSLREMIQAHVARDLAADGRYQKINLVWTAPENQNQDKTCSSATDETPNAKTEVQKSKRRRQVFNAQKLNSLRTMTHFQKDLHRMRKSFLHVTQSCRNSKNWLFSLFTRIPDDVKKIPKIEKILSKLERFTDIHYEGIRPRTFLKVLNGLRIWELCSPDLCVAIEFVRENLVQMSENDYTAWLHSRVVISSRPQSAPATG
uniref:Coiled-coil domain-containing protein 60 isoform X3 n=1 Tax=Geotrypetes seraphini TaxID=260995 RepID=A0A6P8RVY5_GEOSA|nr:coiled-coil domain-containing protein 60 isoform X3 [Geotrypetes seraphini]